MKSNKDILNKLGEILTEDIVDRYYKGVDRGLFEGFRSINYQGLNDLFSKVSNEEKDILKKFIVKSYHSIICDFLNIFEENEEFKLIYEEDGKQVNLVEISEMLKAEPIIENGWIARFSEVVKNDEII